MSNLNLEEAAAVHLASTERIEETKLEDESQESSAHTASVVIGLTLRDLGFPSKVARRGLEILIITMDEYAKANERKKEDGTE